MTAKKYELTDEHRAQLKPWADRWIANALNCDPMNDTDRDAMTVAVNGLYDAANLERPVHIVFVQSPLVAAAAGGFAAYLWDCHKRGEMPGLNDPVQRILDAASVIAGRAYGDPTKTWEIAEAVLDSYNTLPDSNTRKETKKQKQAAIDAMLDCASEAHRMWNGGNQWSSWVAFLSFFRHVAKLPLDYSKWEHYENAAIHGGPRVMHEKFTIVSDRPMYIHQDDQHRPHCDTGPFCEWRDGWKLWYVHGVRVNEQIVMQPDTLTVEQIRDERNVEVRRVMMDRFGKDRFIEDGGAELVAQDDYGKLWRSPSAPDEEDGSAWQALEVTCPSTGRVYFLRVPPSVRRAEEAWRWTLDVDDDALVAGQS